MTEVRSVRLACALVVAVMVTAGCSKSSERPDKNGATAAAAAIAPARAVGLAAQTPPIVVVDMIPEALSLETNQDSEPFLGVHEANAAWMVASAFTPDPAGPGSATAPVFITQDAGASWTLNSILPSLTHDITHAFDGKSLYTGILRADDDSLLELITGDFTSSDVMTTQANRSNDDQPFVRVTTSAGSTYVYVGNNDTSQSLKGGNTATVDVSTNGGAKYTSIRLESRKAANILGCSDVEAHQDGPAVRPSAAKDGVVYAAYFGWRTFTGNCNAATVTSDVVVVRDDARGVGPHPFQALTDPADHLSGRRVVAGVTIPWANQETLAYERVGSTLALAVDPNDSTRVLVAWADRPGPTPADVYTVHVRGSSDKGATWSAADLFTRARSTNAALAVADNGTVGLAYQELVDSAGTARWKTHLVQTRDNFATMDDLVLADTRADEPKGTGHFPYLGDYLGLVATAHEFRGVFSASNHPDKANFPQGVTYQRRVDFGSHRLLDAQGHDVAVSIDPFYFSVPVKQ